MTISKTPRRDLAQGSPDCGPDALARANTVRWDFTDKPTQRQLDDALARAMADDNIIVPAPPQPWSEPVERELWIDWRAVSAMSKADFERLHSDTVALLCDWLGCHPDDLREVAA